MTSLCLLWLVRFQVRHPWIRPLLRPVRRAIYHIDKTLFCQIRRKGYPCTVSGYSIRVAPEFYYDFRQPLTTDAMIDDIIKALSPGDVVLDVGSWIGAYALCFGKAVGTTGRVYAFEPTPSSFSLLQKHIVLNNLENIVFAQEMALGAQPGLIEITNHPLCSENVILLHPDSSLGKVIQVPMSTVDEFCARHQVKPDLIKIDIEGYELEALRGAKKTLQEHRPRVFCELHPFLWPQSDARTLIEKLLDEIGYEMIMLGSRTAGQLTVEFVQLRHSEV